MRKIVYFIKQCLDHPFWLLIFCSCVVCMHLVLDGSFMRMWHLYNSRKILENRIKDIQTKNTLVKERLKKMSDSRFLEKEVRDRFNLVGEEDIIFIFSEEHDSKAKKENDGK